MGRKAAVVILAAVLAAALGIAAAVYAKAAPTCDGGNWTNVSWKNDSPNVQNGVYQGPGGHAEVQFDWSVPDSAKEGDTFTFSLPPQLQAVDTGEVPLRDSKGNLVANGRWEGKNFVITLTDYANDNFGIHGDAFVSVNWDRSGIDTANGYEGSLDFNACGGGSLQGKYIADGPSGDTHDDGKTAEYRGYDAENGVYVADWTVGISGNNRPDYFTVTDRAPEGWKFACDGKYSNGYYPVKVSTFKSGGQGPESGIIYSAAGNPQGGVIHGVTGVANEVLPQGHHYELSCTPDQITVNFPYGVDPNSSPFVNVRTISESKPAPGSTVVNTADIGGNTVTATLRMPNAGGQGQGRKGGFTVEKIIAGAATTEAFDFNWQCSKPGGTTREGVLSVAAGDFGHVEELEKDMTCTVSEAEKIIDGKSPKVSWTVNGEAVESPSFVINDPNEDAVNLVVTNEYEKDEPSTEPTTEPSTEPTTKPTSSSTKPSTEPSTSKPTSSSTKPSTEPSTSKPTSSSSKPSASKPSTTGKPGTSATTSTSSSTQPAAPGAGKPGAPGPAAGGGGKSLPVTGASAVPLALASLAIIAIGTGLVWVRRKKRA